MRRVAAAVPACKQQLPGARPVNYDRDNKHPPRCAPGKEDVEKALEREGVYQAAAESFQRLEKVENAPGTARGDGAGQGVYGEIVAAEDVAAGETGAKLSLPVAEEVQALLLPGQQQLEGLAAAAPPRLEGAGGLFAAAGHAGRGAGPLQEKVSHSFPVKVGAALGAGGSLAAEKSNPNCPGDAGSGKVKWHGALFPARQIRGCGGQAAAGGSFFTGGAAAAGGSAL